MLVNHEGHEEHEELSAEDFAILRVLGALRGSKKALCRLARTDKL
jgi:hypothetical protein